MLLAVDGSERYRTVSVLDLRCRIGTMLLCSSVQFLRNSYTEAAQQAVHVTLAAVDMNITH